MYLVYTFEMTGTFWSESFQLKTVLSEELDFHTIEKFKGICNLNNQTPDNVNPKSKQH